MSKVDEYRAYAAECQRMANASAKHDDKRQWLNLAQSWLGLMRTREHRLDGPVQAEATVGTHQQDRYGATASRRLLSAAHDDKT
jgi:hypothetical protein